MTILVNCRTVRDDNSMIELLRRNVFCLEALGTRRQGKLYRLAFTESSEALSQNGSEVHKYIVGLVVPLDEAIPFCVIEPLDFTRDSLRHNIP